MTLLTPSWQRESGLQHFRPKIFQHWRDAPNQQRQTNHLFRQITRIDSAHSELARSKGECFLGNGYAVFPGHLWIRRFRVPTLPNADFWYKSSDNIGWLGKIAHPVAISPSNLDVGHYVVRFLDDPGPIKLTFASDLYSPWRHPVALGA